MSFEYFTQDPPCEPDWEEACRWLDTPYKIALEAWLNERPTEIAFADPCWRNDGWEYFKYDPVMSPKVKEVK